ncbi:MAG: hypothetical protein GXP17_06330 [Gammaproteobacteria bacterium]|nr:hypothetical protein [Gammaproteobacteria bacterium]
MKKWGLITLMAIATGILLSGCLVSKKDPVFIERSTDNMRIYQDGDFILYDVSKILVTGPTTQNTTGTLRIDWKATAPLPDLNKPGDVITVLKELTTLNFPNDDAGSDIATVRYISQDDDINSPSYGSIRLHAFEAPGQGKYYWLNLDGSTNGDPVVKPFTVFPSPLSVGQQDLGVEFYVMEGCNPENCSSEIGKFTDNPTIDGDTTQIRTNLATYVNPFEISFNGEALPTGGSTVLPVLFDIRGACGANQQGKTTFSGRMFVMPEIGVLQMTTTCIYGTGNVAEYFITYNNSNIP